LPQILQAGINATHAVFRTSENRRNLLVIHCFISHLKEVFCCDFKINFLIKSGKLIFIREFINHSNSRYNSIPWTCLWEICDFRGSVKQGEISIVYVWAVLYLYNRLIKVRHRFLERCTVHTCKEWRGSTPWKYVFLWLWSETVYFRVLFYCTLDLQTAGFLLNHPVRSCHRITCEEKEDCVSAVESNWY
jgi:hypothetical protein